MRQELLVALVLVVLASNIILSYEVYLLIHGQNAPAQAVSVNASAVNLEGSKLVEVNGSAFSFEYKFALQLPTPGVYLLGIKPTGLAKVYVIVYLDDGQAVTLSLNQTYSTFTTSDTSLNVTMFVSGVYSSSSTPTSQQVFDDLGLYYKFLSPLKVINASGGIAGGGQGPAQNVTQDHKDDHGTTNSSSDDYNSTSTSPPPSQNNTNSSEDSNSHGSDSGNGNNSNSSTNSSSGGNHDSGDSGGSHDHSGDASSNLTRVVTDVGRQVELSTDGLNIANDPCVLTQLTSMSRSLKISDSLNTSD
jgi:uncharacterized membrane protein YgcG